MPIVKETSARLVKRNITHDAISREVVKQITNPVALAIYAYLLTKPTDWTVRRGDILAHFDGLGRDRYDAAMRQLKDLGLVWVATIRGEGGHFINNEIILEQTLPRDCMKTDPRENPTLGKSDHLKKKRLPTEEEIGIRGWDEWVDYRKEIRKSLTPSTVKKQVKQLEQYTPSEQQSIINQSIQNGWTGLFPIKESKSGQNSGNGKSHSRKGPKVTTLADILNEGHVIDG